MHASFAPCVRYGSNCLAADRRTCDAVLERAVKAVKELDLPHLEVVDVGNEIIH